MAVGRCERREGGAREARLARAGRAGGRGAGLGALALAPAALALALALGRLFSGGGGGVDPLLQLLADLEEGELLWLYAHRVPGARVAPLVGLVATDLEA